MNQITFTSRDRPLYRYTKERCGLFERYPFLLLCKIAIYCSGSGLRTPGAGHKSHIKIRTTRVAGSVAVPQCLNISQFELSVPIIAHLWFTTWRSQPIRKSLAKQFCDEHLLNCIMSEGLFPSRRDWLVRKQTPQCDIVYDYRKTFKSRKPD